jgi:hypothetical protein
MRKLGLVIGAASLFALTAAHAEDPAVQVARPVLKLAPTVKVVGFRRHFPGQATPPANPPPYTGGVFYLAVDVQNLGAKAVEGVVVKLGVGDKTFESPVSIGPKATATAVFTDGDGLASSCAPKPYTITLSGPNTANASVKAKVIPTCTFPSSVDEQWNHATPDSVEYAQKNNVFLTDASVLAPPSCQQGPKIKVRIGSQYSGGSPSLVVQAKTWDVAKVVKAQTAAAFPLAPKEYKDLILTPVANGNSDVAPKLILEINDWTKSLGGHIANSGILITSTRSCALAGSLE